MLATLWTPSIDPITPASVWPTLALISLLLLSSRLIPKRIRFTVQYIAPILIGVLAFVYFLIVYGVRTFPGLSEHLGYYFIIGAGFGYGLHHLHHFSKPATVLGYIAFLLFCNLIVLEICLSLIEKFVDLLFELNCQIYMFPSLLTIFGIIFYFELLVVRILRVHHRKTYCLEHDLCVKCEYDMRGNLDATHCPECGNAFCQQ